MVVKVGFGKALRTLSDLADAVVASGAMTEMSGAEFITYAARQLAIASTEPKDEAACRIAALKAAIETADEQTRGTHANDICVFVKVYDSDTADFAQIESVIAQCKSTISALRLANVGTPTSEEDIDDYEEAEIAPESRVVRQSRQAAEPAPRRRSFHDDDPDADDWEAEQTSGSSYDDEGGAPSYEVDEDADADELDQHMKALAGVQITPPRPARTSRQSRGSKPQAPAAPARKRGRGTTQVQTARGIAKPRRIPMPRPMSPAELATAVRQGHGDRNQSRITSSLA